MKQERLCGGKGELATETTGQSSDIVYSLAVGWTLSCRGQNFSVRGELGGLELLVNRAEMAAWREQLRPASPEWQGAGAGKAGWLTCWLAE